MTVTLKDKLLKLLMDSPNEPVSGQQMADRFNVSRTAIWKNMKQLEEEGYQIESVRKKGYQLLSQPDILSAVRIAQYLRTEHYGRNVQHYMSCPSTQQIGHELAQQGAPDGTLVIAEKQLQGKGRMARPWASESDKGLWMSLVIRPALTPHKAPQLTLVAAVSIVRAIEQVCGLQPVIKWPNDLLLNDLKITGILTEMQAEPDVVKSIIIGMGMNINQEKEDFPEHLQDIATSLKIESGQTFDRAEIAAEVVNHLEKYTKIYIEKGFTPIKILWESYSNTIGKQIRVVMLNEVAEGKAIGITEDGMLEIEQSNGSIRKIYSGDIQFQ